MVPDGRIAKIIVALALAAVAAHGSTPSTLFNESGGHSLRQPPPSGGNATMILYGSTMSPFVRKVAAYAAEKGIEIDLQPTGFPNFTPEFRAASPFAKMPA
ncbi:MAG: glutathione S-transferase family protein, partial [Sphingomicrobium sp.]